jgi:uncharacterized protein with PIN domain
MSATPPTFIADAALGRLATWLRLLGYDTEYARTGDAVELLRRARTEARILLTRNTRVRCRRALPPYVFITSDDFRAQLRQVLTAYGLPPVPALVRCARCNTPLQQVDRDAACARVPAYVWATQVAFAQCPRCARIYWAATHVARMRRELDRLHLAVPAASSDGT